MGKPRKPTLHLNPWPPTAEKPGDVGSAATTWEPIEVEPQPFGIAIHGTLGGDGEMARLIKKGRDER